MKRTADYLKSRNLPGTFGICVKSLENAPQAYPDWIRANAYQNGGLFEFWQHGWDHAMNIKWKGKTYTAEFAVEDADYQRERFDKSQSVFLDRVGIPLQGFNAPCGVTTSHTLDILRDHPEITYCLFYPIEAEKSAGKFVFRRSFNLEASVGKIEYNEFCRQYRNRRGDDYAVIQGHPDMWNDSSFHDFKMIVDLLLDDGWIFTTPSQYLAIKGIKPSAVAPAAAVKKNEVNKLFPFPMGGNEPNHGVTDMSYLNDTPAGKNGHINVENGHFVDPSGRRIRFLATNFTFSDAFPTHEHAKGLAKRLASMGINCARIHHIDKEAAPAGIWKKGLSKKDTIDPEQLDRLDFFISELKKNGIYINFNLHVSRQYWEGADFSFDNLSSDKDRNEVMPKYGKGLDRIFEPLIEMQKEYAKTLLFEHVNPYTGISYGTDPAVAIVEINNENTIFGMDFKALPDYYANYIRNKWNSWLGKRYASTDGIKKVWGSSIPLGNNIVEKSPQIEGPAFLRFKSSSPDAATVEVYNKAEQGWQAQLQWRDLTLVPGDIYTLSFSYRASTPCNVRFTARHQFSDWWNCGLSSNVKADKEWKSHTVSFTARNTKPASTRIDFVLGEVPLGIVEISNFSLKPGGERGLREGESLEKKNIDIVSSGIGGTPRGADWNRFLAEVEREYTLEMRKYLIDDLGVQSLIFDSQASYGGIFGLYRESLHGIIDMHSYWQHPSFPRRPWDWADWSVRNISMAANHEHASNLGGLAAYRMKDMPFLVTEYDHPSPNQYVAEMFPMIASYGALQDWDGIFQFDWGSTGGGENRINRYFDLQNHPAKLAYLPVAALLFRTGDIAPLPASSTLTIPANDIDTFASAGNSIVHRWRDSGLASDETMRRRIEVVFDHNAEGNKPVLTRSEDKETTPLTWKADSPYMLDAATAKLVAGSCAGREIKLTGAKVDIAERDTGFASIALVAADRKPISDSKRLLLVAAAGYQNTDMKLNKDKTSCRNDWGVAPTLCEGIDGKVSFNTSAKEAKAFALDGKGNRKGEIPVKLNNGELFIDIGAKFETIWYEVVLN
ncbi:MAG: hypothetical protein GX804_06615 [Lentisphaerae bacterium]|nr:hypothetical protein [Lentisphaerota bacterium]